MNRVAVFVDAGYLFAQGSTLLTGAKKPRGHSLIITDMISLWRNGAMADAVLLSGDEDLRVRVQQAQQFGVRVHLLGIKPSRGSQSLFLLQEADSTHEWGDSVVRRFLTFVPRGAESMALLIDSVLLARARTVIGRDLEPKEKKALRMRFIAHCETRLPRG